ncbi:MAG: FlgD immunoglobulin-like domain containing protein [Candidatus Zixiibacteriota bacterium]
MKKVYIGFLMVICLFLVLVGAAQSFYFPPTNIPPGPPPNYTQVDTSYFDGVPSIPLPPPEYGGIYVWYDQGMWNFANHIYSLGNSLEQFHCCILVVMNQPPTPNVNVFAEEFELVTEDYTEGEPSDFLSTCSKCLLQNDRWGWKPWGENLYEIWWDVTTREWKEEAGDPDDFMRIIIAGNAVDFNFWSSGHNGDLDADQVFLGGSMTPLSGVPAYSDFFPGISDPYQSQAGSDPAGDPNITIFVKYSDTLRSYNGNGLIDSTDSYSCDLAEDYGERYSGTFAYEGNGIQFSTNGVWQVNTPPQLQVPDDTSYFLCPSDSISFQVCATDSDLDDTLNIEKISGPGSFTAGNGISPLCCTLVWFPSEDTTVEFVFRATDRYGAIDEDTLMVEVVINEPPEVEVPPNTTLFLCEPETLCFDISISNPDGPVNVNVNSPWHYNSEDTSICLFATSELTYCCIVEVSDSCQVSDTKTFCVTVDLDDPPQVNAPDTILASPGQTVKYSFTASDPDGIPLNDSVNISVEPDCGECSLETPAGSSVKEWKVTFETENCATGWRQVVVEVQDSCGKVGSGTTYVKLGEPSDVAEGNSERITSFFLKQNYPNPFNLSTEISFQLPQECKVDLKIYNLKGQRVKTVVEKEMNRGVHILHWDGTDDGGNLVASGIYFYKLKTSDFVCVRKMVLLK